MNENWGTQRCDIYKKEFDVIMMQNVEKEAFEWPSLESSSAYHLRQNEYDVHWPANIEIRHQFSRVVTEHLVASPRC